MFFRRVEYDRDRQVSIASQIMSVYAAAITNARGNDTELGVLVGELALFFVVLRGIFKHPAYAAEREYRLFNTLPRPRDAHATMLQFRASRSAIVPYYEIQLQPEVGGRKTLTEVVIGPCLQPLAENSIRALLDQTRLTHVLLHRSNVQMRGD